MQRLIAIPATNVDLQSERSLVEVVQQTYGDDEELVQERVAAWRQVIHTFFERFGKREEMLLIRAPARANLLGKHSDFQGGRFNCICLPSELLVVACPRGDDGLVVCDTRPQLFPELQTRIGDVLSLSNRGGSWTDFLVTASGTIEGTRWINYLAGPFVYLQHRFPEVSIRGIDAVVSGNIVYAAGLSSSSAMSVAAMLAACAFNKIDRPWSELASWAGEAEWFSGMRGGAGDHAAILLTPRAKLAHMRARPSVELKICPFPDSCEVLAVYCGKPAIKSSLVNRNIYNGHSVSYRFGVEWLRRECGLKIDMIADLIDERLGLSEREILDAIGRLPERATRSQLRRRLKLSESAFAEMTCSHDEPQAGYPIRRVCLFGVAEFSRSRLVPELLERADVRELGRLINVSHDGDRVVTDSPGGLRPYPADVSDNQISALKDLAARRPGHFPTLPSIPGGYGNSCPELDVLADSCRKFDGVHGAGLTGAGLGGHLLVLVERGAAEPLLAELDDAYFHAAGLPGCAYRCPPVGGATIYRLT